MVFWNCILKLKSKFLVLRYDIVKAQSLGVFHRVRADSAFQQTQEPLQGKFKSENLARK